MNKLGGRERIKTSKADAAFEAWGRATFAAVVPLVPAQMLTPAFLEDRKTVAPVLTRPDLATLGPSATAEFQSRLTQVENHFLADSPYINGDKLSVADIHVVWPLRSALLGLGLQDVPAFGREKFPKVWSLIDNLPTPVTGTIGSEDGVATILAEEYFETDLKISEDDPLDIPQGAAVTVESTEYGALHRDIS